VVGQRLMASAAVAAFVPAELCPDHFVAAGKLTQAELLTRDLGHGRLLLAACPSLHAVTMSGRFSFTGRAATRGQRGWAGDTGRPGMRHRGEGGHLRWVGGHTEAPDLSGIHNRPGAAAAAPERRVGARASTVDRPRSVTCWRMTVVAVEADDSLETWLTTGRPARSKRDTRAACRRRSEKARGPGLEPRPPACLARTPRRGSAPGGPPAWSSGGGSSGSPPSWWPGPCRCRCPWARPCGRRTARPAGASAARPAPRGPSR